MQIKRKTLLNMLLVALVLVIVGVILFALVQTGGGKAMGEKLRRNASELTGGLLGKKRDKPEKK